ncbi:MAG: hypothetical protein GX304_02230 [Clostridiales bacterium]|jgi:hypothetical protein|nr:hypothetical protein [Clostridiales bacterium]
MICENLELITLEPVRYELAQITYGEIPLKRRSGQARRRAKPFKAEGIIDAVIRSGFILLIALAMITAINFIGFENFIENLRQVVENQQIEGFWVDAQFV